MWETYTSHLFRKEPGRDIRIELTKAKPIESLKLKKTRTGGKQEGMAWRQPSLSLLALIAPLSLLPSSEISVANRPNKSAPPPEPTGVSSAVQGKQG